MSSTLLRQASSAVRVASRSFTTSSVARKDFVQDLYLRELKSYKPAPQAKDAHVGVVKAYSLPPKPQVPTLPADLATELAAFDAAEPTKAEVKAAPAAASENATSGGDAFLEFLEADLPAKDEAHH